jgi:hypothetical protein
VVSRLIAQLDFRAIERTTLPLAETEDGGNVSERTIRLASMVFRLLKISKKERGGKKKERKKENHIKRRKKKEKKKNKKIGTNKMEKRRSLSIFF